jgi:hypothetical protein
VPLPAVLAPVILGPVALRAAQIGAGVAIGLWLARRRGPERLDILAEDALDRLPEGADLRLDPDNGRADAEARWARTVRLGARGPGVAVEIAALGRLKVRRVAPGA